MAAQSDRFVRIEVTVQATSALLEGLEVWQHLGLLSDTQIKQVGDRYLSCALPEPVLVTAALAREAEPESDFVIEPVERSRPRPRTRTGAKVLTQQNNVVAQRLQSLMAEISVIWLLFLGVFMVVVSSGVLAASQWRNFPPTGQYGILLAYTLAFWAVGLWAAKRPNL